MSHDSPDAFAREVERRAYSQRVEVFVSSRDAGQALTAESLRQGITLTHLVEASRDLADYADDAIAIVTDEYKPRLDCKEGCSYCCRKPGVLVGVPELLRILEHLQTTFDPDAIARVRERARRYVEQLAGRSFDEPTNQSVPCPLLSDERCSVYDIRPLTCRGYNSTSVEACRQAHESTGVLVPIFALIKDVTDGTTVGAASRLREVGFNDSLVDLGTALNIALDAEAGLVEAIVGGADALVPAQNSTWVDELWTQVRQTAREIGVDV